MPQEYVVPGIEEILGLKIISEARAKGLGLLYGIDEAKLKILQQSNLANVQDSNGRYITDYYEKYNPDIKSNHSWDGTMSQSLLGMPVMMPLTINPKSISYNSLDGKVVQIPKITFEAVVCNVKMNKNIEKTQITGRDTGSVKEYIGLGDFDVEIRAIITSDASVNGNLVTAYNQDGRYPYENMEQILKVLNAPIALEVESYFLNRLGIKYLVVENAQVNQVEGEYSVQRLVINTVSDNPLIIKIAQQ